MSRLAAILLVAAVALGYDLAGYPLLDPDEGRNAGVAREMAAADHFLHPRLDGLPYVDKPVLFFAATALSLEMFGPTEWAARLPALLFTLATVGLVGWWGRRWFGPAGGWIAAIATAAAPLTVGFARTVIFDSALTLFVTASMLGFAEGAAETGRAGRTPWWSAAAWLSLALGVLTKGPIAVALPLMAVVPYLAWRRRWRPLVDPVGILLFVAVVLPWVLSMAGTAPGYLRYVLVTETWERLTTPALQRTGPWWYFLPVMVGAAFPWSAVALGSARELQRRLRASADTRLVFLLLWILVPLVFFTLSQSKRPQYVLPLVPAVGLLAAALWSGRTERAGVGAAAGALAALGVFLWLGHGLFGRLIAEVTPPVANQVPPLARVLGAACGAGALAAWIGRRRLDVTLAGLALPVVVIPLASPALMREIGRDRSAAELAAAIRHAAPASAEIVGVGAYPPSLSFYMGRPVTLATADARELTSNYLIRSHPVWRRVPGSPLRAPDWWRGALADCGRPRVFVSRADDVEAHEVLSGTLPLIAVTRQYEAWGPCGVVRLAVTRARE